MVHWVGDCIQTLGYVSWCQLYGLFHLLRLGLEQRASVERKNIRCSAPFPPPTFLLFLVASCRMSRVRDISPATHTAQDPGATYSESLCVLFILVETINSNTCDLYLLQSILSSVEVKAFSDSFA
jgi:hypothetical protein